MKVFPSHHERELFGIIISFCIGILVGLLPALDSKTIIGALATLFAAFIGAYFAYKLNTDNEKKRKNKIDLASVNKAIFSLTRAFNYLASFNKQFVMPIKGDPMAYFLMRPSFGNTDPDFTIDYDSICFLIAERKAEILSELTEFEELFAIFIDLQKLRNNMHINIVQPAMENAGIENGSSVTLNEIDSILGKQTSVTMKTVSTELIDIVQRGEVISEKLATKLHNVMVEIFPGENVVKLQRIES